MPSPSTNHVPSTLRQDELSNLRDYIDALEAVATRLLREGYVIDKETLKRPLDDERHSKLQ